MLLLVTYVLYAVALSRVVQEGRQHPLLLEIPSSFGDIPGGSIVRYCPESRDTDILAIGRAAITPQFPVLNEQIHVIIWGNLTRKISPYSTVDYWISTGVLNGTFGICYRLQEIYQLPDSDDREKACRKREREGPTSVGHPFWFTDWRIAPRQWSVKFDAKTPEGDRIYCFQVEFDIPCPPKDDDPGCLRNLSDTLDIRSRLLN